MKKPTKPKAKKAPKKKKVIEENPYETDFGYHMPVEVSQRIKKKGVENGGHTEQQYFKIAKSHWTWTEKDAPAVAKKLNEYFNMKAKDKKPPTLSGIALHLGINIDTLADWRANRSANEGNPRPAVIVEMLRTAKLMCEEWVASNMLTGDAHPVASIFTLKNNFGWKDKTEQDVTSNGESLMSQPIVINMPKKDGGAIEGKVTESLAEKLDNLK